MADREVLCRFTYYYPTIVLRMKTDLIPRKKMWRVAYRPSSKIKLAVPLIY